MSYCAYISTLLADASSVVETMSVAFGGVLRMLNIKIIVRN